MAGSAARNPDWIEPARAFERLTVVASIPGSPSWLSHGSPKPAATADLPAADSVIPPSKSHASTSSVADCSAARSPTESAETKAMTFGSLSASMASIAVTTRNSGSSWPWYRRRSPN